MTKDNKETKEKPEKKTANQKRNKKFLWLWLHSACKDKIADKDLRESGLAKQIFPPELKLYGGKNERVNIDNILLAASPCNRCMDWRNYLYPFYSNTIIQASFGSRGRQTHGRDF